MDKKEVVENINSACLKCGEVRLLDSKLEECNPMTLDVRIGSLDDHVSVQPAAIAYFGSLLKDASRNLVNLKHSYDRWNKKMYATAKSALFSNGGKATVADIEAKVIIDNEKDIEKWEIASRDAERIRDELEVWYEAWRQKSYSMTQHANILDVEINTPSSLGKQNEAETKQHGETKKDFNESKKAVRRIMGKNNG